MKSADITEGSAITDIRLVALALPTTCHNYRLFSKTLMPHKNHFYDMYQTVLWIKRQSINIVIQTIKKISVFSDKKNYMKQMKRKS